MRFLLINDNPAVSRLIKLSVEKVNGSLDEISNFDEVSQEDYDVAFIDSECYEEAKAQALKESLPSLHVVYVASRGDSKPDLSNSVIEKPFLPTDLIDLIEKIEATSNQDIVENEDIEEYKEPGSIQEEQEKISIPLEENDDIEDEIQNNEELSSDGLENEEIESLDFDDLGLDEDVFQKNEEENVEDTSLEQEDESPTSVLDSEDIDEVKQLLEEDDSTEEETPKSEDSGNEFDLDELDFDEEIMPKEADNSLDFLDEDLLNTPKDNAAEIEDLDDTFEKELETEFVFEEEKAEEDTVVADKENMPKEENEDDLELEELSLDDDSLVHGLTDEQETAKEEDKTSLDEASEEEDLNTLSFEKELGNLDTDNFLQTPSDEAFENGDDIEDLETSFQEEQTTELDIPTEGTEDEISLQDDFNLDDSLDELEEMQTTTLPSLEEETRTTVDLKEDEEIAKASEELLEDKEEDVDLDVGDLEEELNAIEVEEDLNLDDNEDESSSIESLESDENLKDASMEELETKLDTLIEETNQTQESVDEKVTVTSIDDIDEEELLKAFNPEDFSVEEAVDVKEAKDTEKDLQTEIETVVARSVKEGIEVSELKEKLKGMKINISISFDEV